MSDTQSARHGTAPDAELCQTVDLLKIDDRLREEMQQLAAINRELLGGARLDGPNNDIDDGLEHELGRLAAINQDLLGKASSDVDNLPDPVQDADELPRLRRENAELRSRLDGLERALERTSTEVSPAEVEPVANAPEEGPWAAKQKEYEAILEEKSEVIRTLHLELHDAQSRGAAATEPATPRDDPRSLKKQLEQELAQLENDEEELMIRMQQLEKAMSKDRAELAHQRSEIQRLHRELNQQVEAASREPGLSDRLGALQRLQGEVQAKQPAPPGGSKSSGLLRRIFGK
jgi:hypothetical protein